MSIDNAWPYGPTVIDQTDLPGIGVEVSTIVVSLDGDSYGETVVFDLRTRDMIAEQRCEADDLTARIQHAEWVSRLSGFAVPTENYEREGRGEIEWVGSRERQLYFGNWMPREPEDREAPLPRIEDSSTDATGGVDPLVMIRYAEDETGQGP